MRVLLVEDNPADALLLRESLRAGGSSAEIVHALNLSDALKLLDRGQFDVTLLDLYLPDAHGLDALMEMHAHSPSVPIVVLTGVDSQDIAAKALRNGAQDYLVKGKWDESLLTRSMRYAIERKHAEQALQKREEHFRSLIENALDIISIVGGDGVVRFASPSVRRVLGYEPDQLAGQRVFNYVHPDDARAVNDLLCPSDRTISREIRIARRDGGYCVLEAAASSYVDEDGRTGVIVNARDITERKKSEDALRAVIDTSPLAIYTLDRDCRVQSWNPAAERVFGWKADEVMGRTVPTIPPEHMEWSMDLFGRMIRGEETLRGFEAQRLRSDGSRMDVSIWSAALRNATGDISGIVVAVADNTERKQLEEQLRLSQRMEAVGRLAGGVAHDFNNLLTIISGYTDLILEQMLSGNPMRQQVEEVRKAADRAALLTKQLLAFGRRQVMNPRIVDLNDIVLELDKLLRRVIGEDIHLSVRLSPNLWSIKADPGHIEQVIINLAVNARDAMTGGGLLSIETRNVHLDEEYARCHVGVKPGEYVMLTVSDTGHGMDSTTMQHIFEPFFTAKKTRGTGLGLATVYGIIKQSDGNIWVYSEPGKGSCFKIYLPFAGKPAAPGPPEAAAVAPAEPARAGETILVAEDEDTVRGLVRQILQIKGYRVLEARHGREALELASQFEGRINLLVTDVVMPHMSGRELTDRILTSRPGLKVLFISGYTDNVIDPHGLLEPGVHFLQKPFSPEVLARKVREILDSPP
jgi:PAS domain S-box-containing protein